MQKSFYQEFMNQLRKQNEELEKKAERYFYNKKVRKPYYHAVGETWDEERTHQEVFMHFTDEEVERIKTLMVEACNQDEDCEPVSTWQEAAKELSYSELCERSEELQKLLGDRLEEANICAVTINFDEKQYFYTFSILRYDQARNKVMEPTEEELMLSDEDYLELLKMQVLDRKHFNYNKLLARNPKLAAKLSGGVSSFDPYVILFDEVRKDAEACDGPVDTSGVLYESQEEDRLYHVIANAQHCKLEIIEEELKGYDFTKQHTLYVTDAIRVMKAMGSISYDEMFVKMKDRFGTASCFDDIKQWLDSKGIKYREK